MKKLYLLFAMALCGALSMSAATGAKWKNAPMLKGYKIAPSMELSPMRDHENFPDGATYTTVFSESFAGFTEGTEDAPAPDFITDEQAQAITGNANWNLFMCQQAGGSVYTSFDEVGQDGPGYVKTPSIDLAAGGGIFRFRVMAKNVNPSATAQELQMFVMNEGESTMMLASTEPMVYNEWTECTWTGKCGVEKTSFMFFGWQGKVLIKDIVVESVNIGMGVPKVNSAEMLAINKVRLSWDKVAEATGYKIRVVESPLKSEDENQEVANTEVGDVDVADLDILVRPDMRYVFYVTPFNSEMEGMAGVSYFDLMPDEVGDGVAAPASNITANGFTANWQLSDMAENYAVKTLFTHTAAADGETITLLDENFSHVPAVNDAMNPLMLSPMLGMGNMDLLVNRQGFSTDFAVMMSMAPGMNTFVFSNMMAAYGLLGKFITPAADFSTGGGKVTVKGTAMSSAGAVVMRVAYVNADGDEYGAQDFDLESPEEINEFEVTLEGGTADSHIVMYMYDMEADEDMVAMFNVNITKPLNQGETITWPGETQLCNYDATSCNYEVALDENTQYSYRVQPYFSMELWGEDSDYEKVSTPTAIAKCFANGEAGVAVVNGKLVIANPDKLPVDIYNVAGQRVAESNLGTGLYIVKVGRQSFKVKL